MESLPFVSCLCPTFCRPRLLENSLACFLHQDYPLDRRELIVLDDAGQIMPQDGTGWRIISTNVRYQSLPEKFNAMAGMARGDVFIIMEDDDIYLPWHISTHVKALANGGGFSKPSKILSTYTGRPEIEDATGRFHASIAFTRELFETVGGWPLTKRGDFDQQFIQSLIKATAYYGVTRVADPCLIAQPSYVFRWASTGAYHGQAFMKSGADETWYDRAAEAAKHEPVSVLRPAFDQETQSVYSQIERQP